MYSYVNCCSWGRRLCHAPLTTDAKEIPVWVFFLFFFLVSYPGTGSSQPLSSLHLGWCTPSPSTCCKASRTGSPTRVVFWGKCPIPLVPTTSVVLETLLLRTCELLHLAATGQGSAGAAQELSGLTACSRGGQLTRTCVSSWCCGLFLVPQHRAPQLLRAAIATFVEHLVT